MKNLVLDQMEKAWWKEISFGLLVAALLLVFAGNTANANDTQKQKRIVVLGDSITAGYGLDPSQAYPAILQQKITEAKLPYLVLNAGVSGDTTAGGLRRVAWAMSKGADVLIIALGGNDGLRGTPTEETEKNLKGIIATARSKNPEILIFIAGMQMPENMGEEFTTRFKNLFPEVASELKTKTIPFLLEGVGGVAKLNQADRIHPNVEGQKIVAATVWKSLEKELAKSE